MAEEPVIEPGAEPASQPVPEPPEPTPAPPEPAPEPTPTPEPAPEPKKHEPEPGSARWNQIYWERQEQKREIEKLRRELNDERAARIEKERGSIQSELASIDAEMEAVAASEEVGAMAKYHALNKKRNALAERAAKETVTPIAQPEPDYEPDERVRTAIAFRDRFQSHPDNVHLTIPVSQGGSFEIAEGVAREMLSDPVWGEMALSNTPMYWKELSDRVAKKKEKPRAANPVEGVTPPKPAGKKKLTIEAIAQAEKTDVDTIRDLARKMYRRHADPVAEYIKVYEQYGGGA